MLPSASVLGVDTDVRGVEIDDVDEHGVDVVDEHGAEAAKRCA